MPTRPNSAGCACELELAALRREVTDLREQVTRLVQLVQGPDVIAAQARTAAGGAAPARLDADQVARDRVALFRSLFAGRDDVYAYRWERDGKKGWPPKYNRQPGQSWAEARDARQYLPLADSVIHDHLSGRITVGLYPMLSDDSCRLLACDFDGADWQLDAQAYAHAAGGPREFCEGCAVECRSQVRLDSARISAIPQHFPIIR